MYFTSHRLNIQTSISTTIEYVDGCRIIKLKHFMQYSFYDFSYKSKEMQKYLPFIIRDVVINLTLHKSYTNVAQTVIHIYIFNIIA